MVAADGVAAALNAPEAPPQIFLLAGGGCLIAGASIAEVESSFGRLLEALRRLGFGESESRSAVASARLAGETNVDELLRSALRDLRPRLRAGECRSVYRRRGPIPP